MLTPADFEKVDTERIPCWRLNKTVQSPLGDFNVDLMAPPDPELLAIAAQMIELLNSQHVMMLNRIYVLYENASEDKHWMKDHDTPRNLEKDQIPEYLRSRYITARRDNRGIAQGSISMKAKWDDEHLISFSLKNRRLYPE